MTRRCNLDGQQLSPRDQAYLDAFRAELGIIAGDVPWWWQAAGRTSAEWQRDQRRRLIANKCPVRIHDDPITCDLPIGPVCPDGLARCKDPHIGHLLRPTGDPDRPWIDSGLRERVLG